MAGKIFINYRRGDDPQAAGRLFDRLEDVFGPEHLFMDVDNIEPGLDFVRVLEEQVAQCDVLISVIGKSWIDARDETGARRLDNPDDFVRIEIESALAQDKRVIPVLVGQAAMPRADELPEPMKPLARRNAVRLTHERFRADTEALIAALQRALKNVEAARDAQRQAELERQRKEVEAKRRAEEDARQTTAEAEQRQREAQAERRRKEAAEARRRDEDDALRRRQAEATRQVQSDDTTSLRIMESHPRDPPKEAALSGWTREQRHVVAASFLGWTLDAFDFFLMVFVLEDIAKEFYRDMTAVTVAIWLTLAMRPLGAFLFGRAADRWGRRPTLMVDVLFYSAIEFASGFAPSFMALLVLRAIYGIAMGGEWGVGASLTMETIPPRSRGFVSGLLQAGYPAGYLLASIVYATLFQYIGWRGMFMIGVVPAVLVLYIRRSVPESPSWRPTTRDRGNTLAVLKSHWRLVIYAVLLMTAFNFFSHGTQDLYPLFLRIRHHFSPHQIGLIAVIYNIGAIIGGIFFGALSERFGRRLIIVVTALLSLAVLPVWAFSATALWLAVGAFFMQLLVQGAWGVIPAHLNELSPDEARGTFPGFAYQLGNLIASGNATLQASLATHQGGNFAFALAIVAGAVAVAIVVLTAIGPEARGVIFGQAGGREAARQTGSMAAPPSLASP
jgi:MFS transporter, SHS family, lactate transporter